jgi:hypothetical protein
MLETKTKTVTKQKCTRCSRVFWPKIDDETDEIVLPKTCSNKKCNSPYWNVAITKPGISAARKKK